MLEAKRRPVEFLTGRRWSVMQDAREAGASWTDIGRAGGITRPSAHERWAKTTEQPA